MRKQCEQLGNIEKTWGFEAGHGEIGISLRKVNGIDLEYVPYKSVHNFANISENAMGIQPYKLTVPDKLRYLDSEGDEDSRARNHQVS